ncbi:hypothetical protein THIOM_000797 [Candidatus Thiomargarita nelsonii]|uniref:Uncharacterized protein n=1 Tax=Candidatus Thiomargarita nelsonii TaxID=1003181 RepID=A0A176S5M2_9GAMM|nr:hypothetical protein THIOM_000797 [Candidatus Thiomargarita nelsonii]
MLNLKKYLDGLKGKVQKSIYIRRDYKSNWAKRCQTLFDQTEEQKQTTSLAVK